MSHTHIASPLIMSFKYFKIFFSICLISLRCIGGADAQKITTLKGKVLDADTKEPIPFVNIAFKGTNIGTDSDFDGLFFLEWGFPTTDKVEFSCVGYENQTVSVILGERKSMDVFMKSTSLTLQTAVITGKKGRYKRKDNPAVELMEKVIARRDDNRVEAADYYEVDRYEKIQFDLNNFDPDALRKRKFFKDFQFILDQVDTSAVNGKPFLPIFIQEASAKIYYRRNPNAYKVKRQGMKVTGMKEYVDDKDLNDMLQVMYQSVNIYQNDIRLLDLSFMSPLSTSAISYYQFYIMDSTAVLNGIPVTKVSFWPANKQNIAFKGDLFITRSDSAYAVVKADFGITHQINVNFVQDLRLEQEFAKQPNGVWARTKDIVVMDFSVLKRGTGFYGTRTTSHRDFVFGQPKPEEYYAGTETAVEDPAQYTRDEAFWQAARHEPLTKKEAGVYQMIDTLQKVPSFRRTMKGLGLLTTGYIAVGPFDVGPAANFYSFNPVEGDRAKFGGETNLKFNKKFFIGGYGAYGFKDQEFKYLANFLYSFKEDFKQNPRHFIRAFYQKDVNLVGQILQLNSPDNFFLSFQRGTRDRMLMNNKAQLEYFLETPSHWSFHGTYTNNKIRPIGSTVLAFGNDSAPLDTLSGYTNSEVGLMVRFAPNEQFIQGRTYRTQLFNKHPIYILRANIGMKGVLGGDYAYQGVSLNIIKRFYMSLFGTSRIDFEVGKVWGKGVPYFSLHLPRANQSFMFRSFNFNMMNYQEFVSDEYIQFMLEHNFNGFIFNKIPLLRKLKWREAFSFKAIYGRLTDNNNPDKNPGFIQFQNDEEGRRVNYTLESKPYIETGFGVGNILKVLRVDAVWRLTHLNNPEIPTMFGMKGFGLRFKFKVEF
jgi:hypothetical protein